MIFLNDLPNSSPMTLHNVSKCLAHASHPLDQAKVQPAHTEDMATANRHFLMNVAAVACLLQSSRYFYPIK